MNIIQGIFNHTKTDTSRIKLEKILGFKPRSELYKKALTHGSKNYKDKHGNPFNYERLEYVGDAILGAVIAKFLYNSVPEASEGYLTKMRSKIVNRDHLNKIGLELGLIDLMNSNLEISKFGEDTHGNLLESIIGAVFLDKGFKMCEKFIHRIIISPHVNISQLEGKITSYKSFIIEWGQKKKIKLNFSCTEDQTAKDAKHFSVSLKIDNKTIAKARSTSRKKAEEKAAQRGYYYLQKEIEKQG